MRSIKSGSNGARISGISSEMVIGYMIAGDVYASYGYDCVITSGLDGKHSRGSKHYSGNALDLRTHMIKPEHKKPMLDKIKANLGDDFDAIIEGEGENWEHYHIEFDPKSGINL